MTRKSIMDGIDACRPGSADLELPEMAALRESLRTDECSRRLQERVERLDQRIRTALHDVPIPVGLKERLLDRIAAAASLASSDQAFEGADQLTDEVEVPTRESESSNGKPRLASAIPALGEAIRLADREGMSRGLTRRRWLQAGAAIAASTLVGVCLVRYFSRTPEQPIAANNLADRIAIWHDELGAQAEWRGIETAPSQFPLNRLRVRPARWMDASQIVGEKAVAYDLTIPEGPRATLFVIRRRLSGVGSIPPAEPESATQGRMLAYWQSPDLLYVLIIDDQDTGTYRKLVDTRLPEIA